MYRFYATLLLYIFFKCLIKCLIELFSTHIVEMSENIIADIKKDHEELEYFYSKMKSSTNEDEEKSWFNQFIFEISRHSVGEEQVLYHLMETLGEKGKILAAESREDHDKLKRVLTEILKENNLTLFNSKIDAMMSDLREHIKNEEEKDLVFLS